MTDIVLPSQVRAARALIDWSQETLAKSSNIGLSTVKDFETGRRDMAFEQVKAIQASLAAAGVELLPLSAAGGPGVRLYSENLAIAKQPIGVTFETDNIPFEVKWKNAKVYVFIPSNVLEDLDRTNYQDDKDFVASFRRHEVVILQKTAMALYAGRLDARRRLQLRSGDFFPR
jgi:transcriptional regulator with XRE-family HTH domain